MSDATSPSPQRRPRSPVLLVANLGWAGGDEVVKIRNISEGGVLIEGESLPGPGMAIDFRRGELETCGKIVWSDGRFAGIAFAAPLSPRAMLRNIRPTRAATADADYRRPGFRPRRLSAVERSWIKALGGSAG